MQQYDVRMRDTTRSHVRHPMTSIATLPHSNRHGQVVLSTQVHVSIHQPAKIFPGENKANKRPLV